MSRAIRGQQLYSDCYAHIISRSIRKEKVFKESDDFERFLNLLKEVKEKRSFSLFHYCLMQTHFHFVVQIQSIEDFAKALNNLKRRYVYYYHAKYRLRGPIWRERYKSLLIENELYLHACGQYVEYNPVKAGIVENVEDWAYSSARHYLKGEKDILINSYEIKLGDAALLGVLDGEGNRLTSVDQNSKTITNTYDALNRLSSVQDRNGTTTYGYDGVSNELSVKNPNGVTETYTYDTLNRVLSAVNKNPSGFKDIMIEKQTVLVLGADTSSHLGVPSEFASYW